MEYIHHEVVIAGMGLAALASAARMYELGIRDIAIYTKGYGGSPVIAAINFVYQTILMEILLKNMLKICSMLVIE